MQATNAPIYSEDWKGWKDPEVPEFFNPTELLLDRHADGALAAKAALIADDVPVPDGAHVADTADELVQLLVRIERDLWVAMSELATASGNRHKLSAGTSLVTESMVSDLEATIDDVMGRFEAPREFVVPGETVVAAHLDVARTVVRRAELSALAAA